MSASALSKRPGIGIRRGVLPAVCFLLVAVPQLRAQTVEQTIQETLPRVVKIFGSGGLRGLEGYGTGFLVSPEGHVATVWSHVLDAGVVTVVLDNGRRYDAEVLGAEPQLDLAVLKIRAEDLDLPHFELQQAGSAAPGTRVLAFSNMYNVAAGDEPVSVQHGVIASRSPLTARRGAFEVPYDGPVYLLDAVTNNSGAGGGVVVTWDGTLVGMIGKQLRNAESNTWINYAIPVTDLRDMIEQIITGEYERRDDRREDPESPRRYRPVDFGMVMLPDVLRRTPAYIGSIRPGSPADEAGLRPDDLVLFVNDELVQSMRRLKEKFGRLEAGDTLRLVVRRGDQLHSVEMPVTEKNEPDTQ